MAGHILDPFPLVIDLVVQLPQTFDVILGGFDLHPNTPDIIPVSAINNNRSLE
jgi:hypothetical protein